jgi:hypothetical protein
VIFGFDVLNNGVGDLEEVCHVDGVADVGVKVILEMFEHVHVFLNVLISSNSWEGESVIEEFPGVNLELWCLSGFGFDGTGNVQSVGPMSWVKGLRE